MPKLHSKAFGIAIGTVWALTIFVITAIIMLPGGGRGEILSRIGNVYIGYNPTEASSLIIGPIYAFINGYVAGWLLAYIYNKVIEAESDTKSE